MVTALRGTCTDVRPPCRLHLVHSLTTTSGTASPGQEQEVGDGFLEIDRCQDVLAPFQARWQELATEADRIDEGWLAHPDSYYAPSGWYITPVRYFGIDNPDGIAAAPLLAELVAADGRVMNAMYLRLRGGSVIAPHRGRPVGAGRFHLGLRVPEGCALQIGDTTRTWVEGGWLAFDDGLEHSAWNHSDRDRVILQLDFEHPDIPMPRRAYGVRFLEGVYYDFVRRNEWARRSVMWFNRAVRSTLRPLDTFR